MDTRNAPGLDIGLLTHGWFPDVGGVESHTRDLALELKARGHRVHAMCLDYTEGLEPYSVSEHTVEGVDVRRMAYLYQDHRALADLVENPRAQEAVLQWLGDVTCDVVHVHHATGFGLSALPAIRAAGLPLVMTLHDYWPLCPRGQMIQPDGTVNDGPDPERCSKCLKETWAHLMPSGSGEARGPDGAPVSSDQDAARERTRFALRCLESPHRLFTPSEAARSIYSDAGVDPDRIEVVANGIEVDNLAAQVARFRAVRVGGADDGKVHLGIIGTVLPSKGPLELAHAFREANVPDLTLEVHGAMPSYHGDASYVESLKRLASEDDRIRVHGPFTHDRLADILADLDGVAAPSRWHEVFGLSVREARAAGLPVLVSNAGDLAAIADDGKAGIVVEPDDREGWVRALRQFGTDVAARARWRRHKVQPRTAQDMTLQLERAYSEVVKEATGKEPELLHPAGEPAPPASARRPEGGVLGRLFGRKR